MQDKTINKLFDDMRQNFKEDIQELKDTTKAILEQTKQTNGSVREYKVYKEEILEPACKKVIELETQSNQNKGAIRATKWIVVLLFGTIVLAGTYMFKISVREAVREELEKALHNYNLEITLDK